MDLWRKNQLKCGKRDLLYCIDGKLEYFELQTNHSNRFYLHNDINTRIHLLKNVVVECGEDVVLQM